MADFKVTMSYGAYNENPEINFVQDCSQQVKWLREYLQKTGQSSRTLRVTVVDLYKDESEVLYGAWLQQQRLAPHKVLPFDSIDNCYPTKVVLYFHAKPQTNSEVKI